ncbi:hypothetical protein HY643_05155 [Candidatus Woesearchaeota archaeon]|nr:hypothetical protein [Candidatus Woesearchaeota archaeon]
MGLKDIFGQAEKPVEEKKLEVVVNDESVLDDWMAYFEQTKKMPWSGICKLEDYLTTSQVFLKRYQIKPERIYKFNKKVDTTKLDYEEANFFSVFLSSLIQTSYNQGFNNFKFEEINIDRFGILLVGQGDEPIKIEVTTINAEDVFLWAKNSSLEVENLKGNVPLREAQHCFLKAKKIEGNFLLSYATNCRLEAETINGWTRAIFPQSCIAEVQHFNGQGYKHLKW